MSITPDLFQAKDYGARGSTLALVKQLKAEGCDFEWYPTTTAILQAVKADIKAKLSRGRYGYWREEEAERVCVLDIGAGDGRSLMYLTKGDRFAIEISERLRASMDPRICIVGTDFHHQTLIDKKVDVVFCNPPYSEYERWAEKAIREANATLLYLVIPSRWKENPVIAAAITARNASVSVVDSFDFLSADRAARAKVDVLCVELRLSSTRYRSSRQNEDSDFEEDGVDPFDLWFYSTFHFAEKEKGRGAGLDPDSTTAARRNALVMGGDFVVALSELYEEEMNELFETYRRFESMDPALLREVGVSVATIKKSIKAKIAGLKNVYWRKFFDVFDRLTSRLTASNRRRMLDRITSHVSLDFTVDNAYALAVWAIKNANEYYDSQLIEVFERMVEDANVSAYKSNAATFKEERWRYLRGCWKQREKLSRYKLEYRVVLERSGGIESVESWRRQEHNGLTATAVEYLQDLRTIACNLGFDASEVAEHPSQGEQWVSGKVRLFHAIHKGKRIELMRVRAFKNGNLHVQFNQDFLLRLNVEFGRLKGWLKSKQEAAQELEAPLEKVGEAFASNLRLEADVGALMLCDRRQAA